ncbi:MAG: crotonase/enoyl-CoA hydratase family protein [bacterium]|nr:crotonase/enoyl-CoA hydratase family protein [Gammaproteobacteria bacterium]
MDQADYENIRYEVEDGRARITLARPEKLNAITYDLLQELQHALWEADDNREVHCIILSGEGRAFCTGYDLTGLPARGRGKESTRRTGRSHDDDVWLMERNNRCIRSIWEVHKPTIAQIHGYCLAGGTDLVMGCDMLVAADDAKIGFPAARSMGALPNNLWMYHCGPQWAKRLQLTGDSISGKDAAAIGLVMKSVPADLLEDEVEGLADRLSVIDPDLLAANKRITNLGLELMGAQVLQRLAAENDARAHHAPAVREYGRSFKEHGLKETLRKRDEPFGEGMAHVHVPDGRIVH